MEKLMFIFAVANPEKSAGKDPVPMETLICCVWNRIQVLENVSDGELLANSLEKSNKNGMKHKHTHTRLCGLGHHFDS